METPIFIARQADSHESLEFPIRANHPIRANRANRFARIAPLRSQRSISSSRNFFAQLGTANRQRNCNPTEPVILWTTARKTPAISTRKCLRQMLANRCPTLGQLLASRMLHALLVGEKQHEIAKARFCTQSCSKVGQLLVNSSPTPHPMGSCRGLPCSRSSGNT